MSHHNNSPYASRPEDHDHALSTMFTPTATAAANSTTLLPQPVTSNAKETALSVSGSSDAAVREKQGAWSSKAALKRYLMTDVDPKQ